MVQSCLVWEKPPHFWLSECGECGSRVRAKEKHWREVYVFFPLHSLGFSFFISKIRIVQWFSKWSPDQQRQLAWELVRNASSQTPTEIC